MQTKCVPCTAEGDMRKSPETSVVITCFNYGRYLDGCLCSVLDQSYTDYEIIVIDDGSTDNTPQVIDKFLSVPNLRYIRQKNSGQAKAKNLGIQLSTGQFIAFLDADDLWEKSKLEKQISLFKNPKVGVVYSKSKPMDAQGRHLAWGRPTKYLVARSGTVSKWLYFDNFIPFSSAIIRKRALLKVGVFDESLKMGIDWELWLRMSTVCEFEFVDQELLFYRLGHEGQMSKNIEVRQESSDRIMRAFLEKYPHILNDRIVCAAYSYTFCNRAFYYKTVDVNKSRKHFWMALRKDPSNLRAYKGLIKTFI